MSHREKRGFNRYPAELAVAAWMPGCTGPVSANWAWRGSGSSRLRSLPSGFVPVCAIPGVSFQSRLLAVAQPATVGRSEYAVLLCPAALFALSSVGVGHPVQPLSDVRRTDARSAQIGGPDGISHCLQVSAYSGEPFSASSARNLLSKHDWRAALADEPEELRPQVPFVGFSAPLARDGEGLTWT